MRASIPFWAVDPTIHDPLFNLNGLAHKVVFDAEASYADANQNFTEFPLYDEIDDNAIEEFRRRLFFSPVGSSVLAGYVQSEVRSAISGPFAPACRTTSPRRAWNWPNDLTAVRFGMRHRLQTKARSTGRGADRRLDDVRLKCDLVPRPESRQFRSGHRTDRLRLALARGRPVHDPLRRCGRHVWQRLQDRVARRNAQPADDRQRLPRLPHDGRPADGQSGPRLGATIG